MKHEATYEYNRYSTNLWRVRCTCGWWHIGDKGSCETRFTSHDLGPEWIEAKPESAWQTRLREVKG
jgi:hypothetical protein